MGIALDAYTKAHQHEGGKTLFWILMIDEMIEDAEESKEGDPDIDDHLDAFIKKLREARKIAYADGSRTADYEARHGVDLAR